MGLVRAGLALAAAAALLTTSTTGYAAWQTAHEHTRADVAALESGSAQVFVTSPGSQPREVDPQAGIRITVGDTVTVRMPVTIRTGPDPIAVLRIDAPDAGGDEALVEEFAAAPSAVTISPTDGGPRLTPVPGDGRAHTVTPASDGHTYLLEWSTSTRSTRDGKEPTDKNRWGTGPASLQGLSVGARPLTVTLTPGPPTTPSPTGSPTGAAAPSPSPSRATASPSPSSSTATTSPAGDS